VAGDAPRHDPDYRFTLANERTFLGWSRTALALVAGGVAVVQLVPDFGFAGARLVLGVTLTLIGTVVAAGALQRWRTVQSAMEHDRTLPPTRMPLLLTLALTVVGLLVALLLVVGSP
jgi:putative membrane protein